MLHVQKAFTTNINIIEKSCLYFLQQLSKHTFISSYMGLPLKSLFSLLINQSIYIYKQRPHAKRD